MREIVQGITLFSLFCLSAVCPLLAGLLFLLAAAVGLINDISL